MIFAAYSPYGPVDDNPVYQDLEALHSCLTNRILVKLSKAYEKDTGELRKAAELFPGRSEDLLAPSLTQSRMPSASSKR